MVRREQKAIAELPKEARPEHAAGVLQPLLEQVLPDEEEPLAAERVSRPPVLARPVRPREVEHHLPKPLPQVRAEPLVHPPQQALAVQGSAPRV